MYIIKISYFELRAGTTNSFFLTSLTHLVVGTSLMYLVIKRTFLLI